MRVMVCVKATKESEAGQMPTEQMFKDMLAYNEQLVKAGIMKEGDGLKPSKFAKRIKFADNGATQVIDGPFAETKELVAGYWIWSVKSLEEAVEWARKCPNPMPGEEGVLEIRPTYAEEDFGEQLMETHLENNPNLRKQYEGRETPRAKRKATRRKTAKRPAKRRPARAKSRK